MNNSDQRNEERLTQRSLTIRGMCQQYPQALTGREDDCYSADSVIFLPAAKSVGLSDCPLV